MKHHRASFSRADILVRSVLLTGAMAVLWLPFLAGQAGDFFFACRFHQLTGFRCPTCGLTRSFQSMVHLDLLPAVQHHLLGPVLYLIALVLALKTVLELILRKPIKPRIGGTTLKILAALLLGVWGIYWMVRLAVDIF